jgi:hypothetical protein
VIDQVTLLSPARIEGRAARDNFTPIVGRTISSGFTYSPADGFCGAAGLKDLGTAVGTPEHPTRPVLIPSSHDLACPVEPLAIHLDPTAFRRHGLHFFAPQNAATESGSAGIEIILGERFPSVTVFGLSLARGGHTMKRSISINH